MGKTKPAEVATYIEHTQCRVCGGKHLSEILSLGDQYVIDFVKERDESFPRAPLDLIRCDGCGLLQLKHSVDPALMWGKNYGYRSGINETMRAALRDVVDNGLKHHQSGTWLDIGANDGYLISQVHGFRKIACEPVEVFAGALEEHADKVISGFFSADAVDEFCQVITSCACFYDLDDPNAFVKDIATILAPGGVWINQLTSAKAMLHKNDFPNIVHEHRLYLDLATLQHIYARNGMAVVDVTVNDVNGGSIRVTGMRVAEATKIIPPVPAIADDELADFAERVRRWKDRMGWVMDSLKMGGRTVWGAAAATKGATLLQYLDRSDQIVGIGDRNPSKEGLMMPGVWAPITSETTMRQAKPDVILGLAWPFKQEIMDREATLRREGTAFVWPLPEVSISL